MMRRSGLAAAAQMMVASVTPAHAESNGSQLSAACRVHAPEAAARSGVASEVIVRVMQAESAGKPSVISIKGAMGCMQIMPETWTYLSKRYGLGNDPYAARMNMIGGAMYLAELAQRFGWPGAYAAYNAGPGRYIRFAANRIPLPSETVAYVARLKGTADRADAPNERLRWQEARLFLDRSRATEVDGIDPSDSSNRQDAKIAQPDLSDAAPALPSVPTLFPFAPK